MACLLGLVVHGRRLGARRLCMPSHQHMYTSKLDPERKDVEQRRGDVGDNEGTGREAEAVSPPVRGVSHRSQGRVD